MALRERPCERTRRKMAARKERCYSAAPVSCPCHPRIRRAVQKEQPRKRCYQTAIAKVSWRKTCPAPSPVGVAMVGELAKDEKDEREESDDTDRWHQTKQMTDR